MFIPEVLPFGGASLDGLLGIEGEIGSIAEVEVAIYHIVAQLLDHLLVL